MDGQNMAWDDDNEAAIAKVIAQLEAGDYQAVIEKHSKAIARIEVIWRAAQLHLAGETGAGTAGSLFFEAKAFHCKADEFAASMTDVPMTRNAR